MRCRRPAAAAERRRMIAAAACCCAWPSCRRCCRRRRCRDGRCPAWLPGVFQLSAKQPLLPASGRHGLSNSSTQLQLPPNKPGGQAGLLRFAICLNKLQEASVGREQGGRCAVGRGPSASGVAPAAPLQCRKQESNVVGCSRRRRRGSQRACGLLGRPPLMLRPCRVVPAAHSAL